jgi:hypothetical protein
MLTHVVSLISHILSNSLALEEDFTVCVRVISRYTFKPVVLCFDCLLVVHCRLSMASCSPL